MKNIFLAMLGSVLLMTGCSRNSAPVPSPPVAKENLPSWVTTLPAQPGMLYAVGSAALGELEHAEAAARASLASEFEVSIDADVHGVARSAYSSAWGHRTERYDHDVRTRVHQEATARGLPGIVIIETAESADHTYALARMDRQAWADSVEHRLTELDANLRSVAHDVQDTLASAPNPTSAYVRAYQRLVPLVAERDECRSRLRVAAPERISEPMPIDINDWRERLLHQLESITLTASASRGAEALLPRVIEVCSRQGLVIKSTQEETPLTLKVSFSQETHRVENEYRSEGTAIVALLVPAEGRTLAQMTVPARASGLDQASAERRLVDKLAEAVANDLDQHALEYLGRW